MIRLACFFLLPLALIACSGSVVTRVHNVVDDPLRTKEQQIQIKPKSVAVFLDGTGNDFNSATNVARLHQFVINQDRRDVVTFYTSGVGADSTGLLGLAAGLGFKKDVQAAYAFISENYNNPQDSLQLYGYSRGAYSARVLAGLIYTVGLADLSKFAL